MCARKENPFLCTLRIKTKHYYKGIDKSRIQPVYLGSEISTLSVWRQFTTLTSDDGSGNCFMWKSFVHLSVFYFITHFLTTLGSILLWFPWK